MQTGELRPRLRLCRPELARLSASDVTGRELNKRNRGDEYLRQTILAELWHDPHTPRELQRISTGEIALETKLSKQASARSST
jgi:hypothetical protein